MTAIVAGVPALRQYHKFGSSCRRLLHVDHVSIQGHAGDIANDSYEQLHGFRRLGEDVCRN